MSRMRFMIVCCTVLLCSPIIWAGDVELPVGPAPAPVPVPHFPDRLHAVVWRNWQLVTPEALANVLGATPAQINALAASMGLPPAGDVQPSLRKQAYITVLRRNWHLLPYEQLLQLVDMTPEQLAFALREDDFLFVKFGNLKPKCPPVKYAEPGPEARARAAEIKRLIEERFGPALTQPAEPRFGFLEKLKVVPAGFRPPERRLNDGPRYIYSYCGTYGDPLADGATDSYPDGLLARLADSGVNGVWMHVVLRTLAPGGPDFPEFGAGWEMRLANLRKLVDRAHHFGLDIYLYMNEPRAMPTAFFASRPDMAGVTEGDYRALCTSDPKVRTWLRRSLAHVFREVPGLGGVFTITASENLTSCASHGQQAKCPRCQGRSAAEIIAEVNTTIEQGVHEGNKDAKVIVWDWGWSNSDAIDLLPQNVYQMSVSEWSLPIERGGIKTEIGEYSISSPGPGPRALAHWARSQKRGLKTMAKVQLNNSWELSTVPYLPVLDLVAEHCANLAKAKISGMQLSWSLGGYPSPNLEIADRFAREPGAAVDAVLDAIASRRYGPEHVAQARAAWHAFSESFRQFPFHGQVVYEAPQQFGPANLLYLAPTKYHATMVGFPYDDLDGWRGPYPADVFASQFQKVADGWKGGLGPLASVPGATAAEDFRVARAAGLHFASVANQCRFVLARRVSDRAGMRRIAIDEGRIAREMYDIVCADSRIGFEASNQYDYVPLDFVEKLVSCEWIARSLDAK